MSKLIIVVFIFSLCSVCCSQTITIGTQIWSSKNLDVSTFRNGDLIPHAKTEIEWEKAGDKGKPSWCYFKNESSNGTKFGKLYNSSISGGDSNVILFFLSITQVHLYGGFR